MCAQALLGAREDAYRRRVGAELLPGPQAVVGSAPLRPEAPGSPSTCSAGGQNLACCCPPVLYQQSNLRTRAYTGAHGASRPERWGCEEQLKHEEWTRLQNVALKDEDGGDQVLPLQSSDAPR